MEQKNLILAIVVSMAILLAYNFLIERPRVEQEQARIAQQEQAQPEAGTAPAPEPDSALVPRPAPGGETQPQAGEATAEAPGATAPAPSAQSRQVALQEEPRVAIESPLLTGSISLRGGRVDDLTLKDYHLTVDPKSPNIQLLHPLGLPNAYYADVGWVSAEAPLPLPGRDTLWQADGETLSPGNPLTLTWDNGHGLRFERNYKLGEDYLFTVSQRVVNESDQDISLAPYGLISRSGTPDVLGFYILHEGLLGVFDGTLKELDYSDLQDDGIIAQSTTGGWLGITDKYWLVALIPDQERPVDTRFLYDASSGRDKYQVDYLWENLAIPSGASVEITNRLFAGAKKVTLLDRYRDELGVTNFDRAVDFGWFYFLTKPLFYVLHYFHQLVGNFGIAILILTVIIKLIFFPLANKSYKAMAKMRKLQPEMLRLRERYGDDKQRLNQEMMTLYKKEGANPLSGCLPIVVQIPVFFALYKVLFVTIEMRHAPFFGWIEDLSAPDPTSILNGFGLLPWDVPELGALAVISIGIWPIIMGITMWAQQQLNPAPPDKTQAMIFGLMPIVFTFLLAQFPAGLVIYWTWNNLLSLLQQYVIMRRQGVPIGRGKAAKAKGST
jgi:YidC/Oxa1 family membrane protein insertase